MKELIGAIKRDDVVKTDVAKILHELSHMWGSLWNKPRLQSWEAFRHRYHRYFTSCVCNLPDLAGAMLAGYLKTCPFGSVSCLPKGAGDATQDDLSMFLPPKLQAAWRQWREEQVSSAPCYFVTQQLMRQFDTFTGNACLGLLNVNNI